MSLENSPAVVFSFTTDSTTLNFVDERPLAFLAARARDIGDFGGLAGVSKGLVEARCSRVLKVLGQQRAVVRL